MDPDVVLMLAFRDGDEAAFDQLFRRWAGPLLRYLERMLGESAMAEELVQEAFFRVHRARHRYEPRARFSTWLYRIATNLALNELKRPRRRHVHEEEDRVELRGTGPGVDEQVATRRLGARVESELEKLPERQRMALWLSAAEGHSYAEVASILDTTEKSVKALVHRARAALVSRMGECADSMASVPHRGTA
ncbi:MAG: sigma-70 family RNA polymerase sigma factor [Myxococcota bacterium]|nr:sigma-70 family RNA polymerase sigma factor [Myxococcota bacterium]